MQPQSYNSDSKKIGYVISRLEGSAADWAVTILDNPSQGNNFGILNNWEDFIVAFSKFSDPFARRNSTDQLLALSQGKNQSVLAYWTRFSELLYRSDIQPDSARPIFEKGLKYEIRDRLVDKDLPQDLDGYVASVIDLDNRLYRLKQDRRGFNSNGHSHTVVPFQTQSQDGVAPMDIGAITIDNSPARLLELRKMDKESCRQICFDEKRCFYCKKVVGNPPSHVAGTCPELKKRNENYVHVLGNEVQPQKGILDVENRIPQRQGLLINTTSLVPCRSGRLECSLKIIKGTSELNVKALVDSGAMGIGYVDEEFANKSDLESLLLKEPIVVRTVDGRPCGKGRITHYVQVKLVLQNVEMDLKLLVISSPNAPIILGLEWLRTYNPKIDWKTEDIVMEELEDVFLNAIEFEEILKERNILVGMICTSVNETLLEIPSCIEDFKMVFTSDELPDLPPHRPGVDMAIELKSGETPPFGPIYSLSKDEELELKRYLQLALAKGIISPSKSSTSSPVLFVKKANGKLRLCVDYRSLNKVIETNRAPLPIMREVIRTVSGHKLYSKIDLVSAFNLIRIREGDEWLTAFRTKYGLFQYNVVPFGEKNAPAAFQSFMNMIFNDLLDCGVVCYVDDVLVYANEQEAHDRLLTEVFKRIHANGLAVNPKKCEFNKKEVTFLGHTISASGTKMALDKVKDILDWEPPRNLKELQSFLGLTNFYREFIPGYADLFRPLTDLTKKEAEFMFKEEQLIAFETIKKHFANDVTLEQPLPEGIFYVECDASDFAIGSVVSQMDPKTGNLRPLGFFSKKLSDQEINYDVHDKELYSIVKTFEQYRYLLIGTQEPVVVYSDHLNLKYFTTTKKLNRRQARWSQFLQDFNFRIEHRPGKLQVVSDPLSRQAKYHLKDDAPEKRVNERALLEPQLFVSSLVTPFENSSSEDEEATSDYDINNYSDSLNDTGSDVSYSNFTDVSTPGPDSVYETDKEERYWPYLYDYLRDGYIPLTLERKVQLTLKKHAKNFFLRTGGQTIFRRLSRNGHQYEAAYTPPSKRNHLLKQYHEVLGHLATDSILPLLETRHWWPNMTEDIMNYVSNCSVCCLDDSSKPTVHPLHPHSPIGLPFYKWGIDFIQDLPPSRYGNTQIITGIDYATKRPVAKAVSDRKARTVAEFIFEKITCEYGAPVQIVSDRALSFLNESLREYLEILKIRHLPTTPYHPQSNGAVERMHRTLKKILRKLCRGDWSLWEDFLPQALLVLSSRVHSATGFSPFRLCHGLEPRLPLGTDVLEDTSITPQFLDSTDSSDGFSIQSHLFNQLGQDRAAALAHLQSQSARMKRWYDTHQNVSNESFQIGDLVKMRNNAAVGLDLYWKGPYYVVGINLNDSYHLMNTQGKRLDNPQSFDRLARWTAEDVNLFYSGHGSIVWDTESDEE